MLDVPRRNAKFFDKNISHKLFLTFPLHTIDLFILSIIGKRILPWCNSV